MSSPRHCCPFSPSHARPGHKVTKNIKPSKKVQTYKKEKPGPISVSTEKLLLSAIFSFGTTIPRSYTTRAGVSRTAYSQTELAAALLPSHLICCLLGLTELWMQITKVALIQMQWPGTQHLSAYMAFDTHFTRCCLNDRFFHSCHFPHTYETLIHFTFKSYTPTEWQKNSIF